jgi:hypothetical protein
MNSSGNDAGLIKTKAGVIEMDAGGNLKVSQRKSTENSTGSSR